jgi:hypothetical protein
MVAPSRRDTVFAVLVAVMAAHEAEHVAQLLQKEAFANRCPGTCQGALGFIFDLEWVHFAYNTSTFLVLVGLYAAYRMWRPEWRRVSMWSRVVLTVGISVQGYHVVEHVAKLDQWLGNGHHSPTPGILGQQLSPPEQHSFSLIELHFTFNTFVFLCVLAAYFGFGFARRAWPLAARFGAAPAAVAVALLLAGPVTGAWAMRTPTVTLESGVHGPLVLDRTQILVGEPGAVVRGGIVVTADNVTVRGVTVLAGDYGIEVEGAKGVLIDDVRITGAALDGINVRRSSVTITDCVIEEPAGAYAQGIDISFGFDRSLSTIKGCSVSGGQEGIVTHFAHVRIVDNRIIGSTMRGITVTEMSMADVEQNSVERAVGVAIYCGDYSQCDIERNFVADTTPDTASGNRTRAGFGILAHFGAIAEVKDNRIVRSPGGIASSLRSRIFSE